MKKNMASSTLVPLILTEESMQEDAGTKYVLESKGTWLHAGYHLTSATAGPPLLVLPFAMVALGWGYGILLLIVASVISFYANYTLSLAVEELASHGRQCIRFWDVALHSIGPLWAYCVVAPLQYFGCFIVVVALMLLGGQTLMGILAEGLSYERLKLYSYIIMFGAFTLLLSQFPSFHSLRHFNLLSMMLCLGYSVFAIAGSIVSGLSLNAPPKDYSVQGTSLDITFAAFNSVSMMMTAYANPLVVEIQATLAPPVAGKMLKGLVLCYGVANAAFFSVMISGYWAFGNNVDGLVFSSIKSYAPLWLYVLGNTLAFLQLIVHTVVYLQPLFAKYESMVVDANKGRFSLRNLLPRIAGRSLMVGISVMLASMIPFFADFSALMGAFGFIPLCIMFPLLFHTIVFKDKSSRKWIAIRAVNMSIMALCCVVTLVGTIAATRQIMIDVGIYSLVPSG